MKYLEPKRYTTLEANKIILYGTILEQRDMLIGITHHEENVYNAYKIILSYCNSEKIDLYGLAVICIGNLARIHRFIPVDEVAFVLQESLLNENMDIADSSITALSDIYIFCPKEFVEIKSIIENNFKQSKLSKTKFNLAFSEYAKLPEFKDQSYEIFVKNKDPDTKFTALQIWISYYYNSKNALVLEELYKITVDENYDNDIRIAALSGIFEVVGFFPIEKEEIFIANLLNCKTPQEFDDRVKWHEVTKVLKKYAPNALKIYPINKKKQDVE